MNKDVIEPDLQKFPYAVKIRVFVNGSVEFDIKERVFPFGKDLILKFSEVKYDMSYYTEVPHPNSKVWDIFLESFSTPSEAERAGFKLEQSILWFSISINFPLRIIYNKNLPFTVYDRTMSRGFEAFGYGHSTRKYSAEIIIGHLKESFFSAHSPDISNEKLLLAMEIFSSSQLETTRRAAFISMITSLEALSSQESYEKYFALIKEKTSELKKAIEDLKDIQETTKKSIVGRIQGICKESIRQSILRLANNILKNNHSVNFIKYAYKTRSLLLHNGNTDENLINLVSGLSSVIRQIIATCLNLKLRINPEISTIQKIE